MHKHIFRPINALDAEAENKPLPLFDSNETRTHIETGLINDVISNHQLNGFHTVSFIFQIGTTEARVLTYF